MSYQEEWEYLIKRIKELRIAKGMSIQALADYANMDRPNVSRIEAGRVRGITFETICRIAEVLEVSPKELMR